MTRQAPIITVTLNPAVDISTSAPALEPQRKLRCEAPVREPGGGGVNVARVVRVLGGDALAVMTAGGAPGETLRSLAASMGLRHTIVPIAGETRENFSVEDRSTGALYRFVMPGPCVSVDEVDRVASAVTEALDEARGGNAPLLVVSGSPCAGVPDDLMDRLIAPAARCGAAVFADVPGDWLARAAAAGAAYLKPNQHELEGFAGRTLEAEDDLSDAARALLASGAGKAVFVSLGAAGLLVVERGRALRVNAPSVHVESTIGAGDSTVAGVALALARGNSLADAARWGVAAGSAACLTPGTELCRREDAERLFAEIRYA